ncbi:hypothetical protein BGW80DRAFT_1456153 [Lactifluus volemus]|nr:hypothetical protein BGW80DRAFT_1456153 [Lactifluus volemus]
MSSPLPSFVELMSSLGLEDGTSLPCGPRPFLRPRSHSNASSSSDIDDERDLPHQRYANAGTYLFVSSDCDRRDQHTNSLDMDNPRLSRQGKGRYSPYPVAAIPRKGSVPALFETGKAKRAPSTSPLPSPNPRATRGSRSSPNGRVSPRASETWPTEHATTPISTYLRRKSPQMSPTSATFPRSAFDEPMAPVAIPALPALLSSFVFPQHRVSEPSSPTDISEPQVLVASD